MKIDPDEDLKEVDLGGITRVYRYLHFIAANSFFAAVLFDRLGWLIFVTLFSYAGILICRKKQESKKPVVIRFSLIALFFLVALVPGHQGSFEDYVSRKEMYKCVTLECVKISTYVNSENEVETTAELLPMTRSIYEWRLFYAKGYLELEDSEGNKEDFKGINIAGFWIEY
ncbi:hypothetical protein MM300_19180 [Evansella sp. LMS18]|uniref:hypothetical protein n=1 Tax=Evansella sp. LMS18 TaxID=2924033 RepID=UPI0020D02553|nr:hypothetical protein [Evansella sp. LMS18]UTR09979.1 hypothetical protein MM300_19180 [Evansella sp. LMS18]